MVNLHKICPRVTIVVIVSHLDPGDLVALFLSTDAYINRDEDSKFVVKSLLASAKDVCAQ
jgi:hypothetical protein